MLYNVGKEYPNQAAVGVSGCAFDVIGIDDGVDPFASASEVHDVLLPLAGSGHGREQTGVFGRSDVGEWAEGAVRLAVLLQRALVFMEAVPILSMFPPGAFCRAGVNMGLPFLVVLVVPHPTSTRT